MIKGTVLFLLVAGFSQATSPPLPLQTVTPEQQVLQLRQALAAEIGKLATCHSEQGDLLQIRAKLVSGELVDRQALVTALLKEVEARYAEKNPGFKLDARTGIKSDAPPAKGKEK